MRFAPGFFRAFTFLLIASPLCSTFAQDPSTGTPPQPSNPTLHVTARLVYVDVTVRDSHGQIVRGLTQQDFHLLEDGKSQNFKLSLHTLDASGAAAASPLAPATAPHSPTEFSNVPETVGSSDSISIVLLDLLSTPQTDQLYARKQLLAFLKAMPRGQRVALFVLTDRLHMVQTFTGSSDRLLAAAERINPKDLKLVIGQTEGAQDADWYAEFQAAIGLNPGGAGKNTDPAIASDNFESREYITEAAFRELAIATAGYPGRKNLLWLSESFPFPVGAQLTQTRFMSRSIQGSQETSELFAKSRIAVYPISLLGLEVGGVDASANGIAEASGGTGLYGHTLNQQTVARHDLSETINEIARETGGRAFYGTNDFARALSNSLDDGANYYTLVYTPDNNDWNGHFREVRVELERKGYSLSYRRGYFAFSDNQPITSGDQPFTAAMQPATPEATLILLKSKLLPADPNHPGVMVESIIDAATVTFNITPDGHRHAKLQVALVALNDGEKQPIRPPQVSGTLNLDLEPNRYAFILQSGIAFRQQLALKPGKYRLRLGVSDDSSHRIGTLDMPISTDAQP